MTEQNISDLILEISQKTNKSEEEIKGLIEAKVQKFSGLLTEQGAAFMVQKELGVGAKETFEEVKIGQLQDGMKGIEIKGIVEAIFPLKEFEKNGKKGKLKSFILSDGTGEVRITLWNDQADKYELTKGSELIVSNALVSKYNEKNQVTLGFNGEIKILNKKEEAFEKVNSLKSGMNGVNLVGRLVRKFPCKDFDSGERKGKLCSFQFGDETALLRATAWNEKADELEKFNEGEVVEIKNAYTKEGRFGVELHLGYTATINQSTKEIASVGEILKDTLSEKKINSLSDGENAIIAGKISSVEKGNFYYEVCAKCGKKIGKTPNGNICETCGETTPSKRAVVSIIVEDDTGGIKSTFFGNTALNVLGMTIEGIESALNGKSIDVFVAELNGNLIGKEIKLMGYQKTNSFSGANEFMVREIIN
jgi:replication factor A1